MPLNTWFICIFLKELLSKVYTFIQLSYICVFLCNLLSIREEKWSDSSLKYLSIAVISSDLDFQQKKDPEDSVSLTHSMYHTHLVTPKWQNLLVGSDLRHRLDQPTHWELRVLSQIDGDQSMATQLGKTGQNEGSVISQCHWDRLGWSQHSLRKASLLASFT